MRSGHKVEAAQRGIQGASRDGGVLEGENRGGAGGGVDLVFRFVCDSLLEGTGFEPSVPLLRKLFRTDPGNDSFYHALPLTQRNGTTP
jgi:hypothetical protein